MPPCRAVGSGAAFAYELVLTAFLMFVIMAVATDTRAVGAQPRSRSAEPSPSTPCSAGRHRRVHEPGAHIRARARGVQWTDFWIYLVAPVTGALAGAMVYALIRGAPETVESA